MQRISNTKPLVSVIMAVRDTDPYLRECLDSITAQTYQNWELIAVNDHSVDESPDILNEYAAGDSRINVFNSDQEKLIPTLQAGYKQVNGELINRMDSDDRMPLDKLEVLVAEWLKHGEGAVIAGGTQHFVEKGVVGGGFLRYEQWLNKVARDNLHFQEIYHECVIPSHSWIMHKNDFDRVGAFNPLVYPEDYDLCFRIYREKLKVVGIDKVLHFWRDRQDRISRTWDEYKDNRYFDLKLKYFFELDRDRSRPLVIWGAGKNGKDLVRLIKLYEKSISWVCDNPRKVGREIYGIILKDFGVIPTLRNPQILIVVTAENEQTEIKRQLTSWGKEPVRDYWFCI